MFLKASRVTRRTASRLLPAPLDRARPKFGLTLSDRPGDFKMPTSLEWDSPVRYTGTYSGIYQSECMAIKAASLVYT